jgi:DNA ligase-1
MAKREYTQLAHVLNPAKHPIAGMFASEKLDGERAIWDGGVTRGLYADEVPWSNTAKDKKRFYATGLWTRRGKVVHAPAWWLDKLPPFPLDGELFAGRKEFQSAMSVCRNQSGTSDWTPIQYRVFDTQPMEIWLGDGEISDKPHFVKTLRGCYLFWKARCKGVASVEHNQSFRDRYTILKMLNSWNDTCVLHEQELLPLSEGLAKTQLDLMLEKVLTGGGEGLILKSGHSLWRPARVHDMLKYKPFEDMECEVIGYTTGRETELGSRLLGKMGALICKIPAGEFKVSGFTDEERELAAKGGDGTRDAPGWAREHPEEVCPGWMHNPKFPVGSHVTIKYRELTNDGLPKEGRYWRDFKAV